VALALFSEVPGRGISRLCESCESAAAPQPGRADRELYRWR
jgi:hypothetical protein